MTTDPATPPPRPPITNPRPTAGQRLVGRPTTRVVTVSSPGPLIGAVLTLVLGVLLGLANQAADGTDMALRVPALLAALLMVAQGAYDFRRHLPRRAVVEETGTVVIDGDDDRPRPTELATVRPMPQAMVSPVVVRPTPATLSVPITTMVLAAWLGLADLRVEAPPTLALLSLIASFALFALGWTLLPARR